MNNTGSSQPQSSTTHTLSQSVGGVKGKNKRIFDEMMAYESQTITSAGKSQLDLYLEEPKLEFAYYQDLDILEHWKNQKHRYPTLALMACDVLAIPITTVASESTFSIGARVLTNIVDLLIVVVYWSVDLQSVDFGSVAVDLCNVDLLIAVVCCGVWTCEVRCIVDLLNLRTVVPVVE
ncbi:hypothetical protein ZIOFF_032429 [Zingiber officinale]|uniref:HAT C-terminal dimerisation domain-containing protein n=1 Tax=Zingiber officinale TaxID=94328 RepID=A0A8J5GVK1_ZINOF|nr:hypothetical protein ZIOFF_032429 [Zingiber officinale]